MYFFKQSRLAAACRQVASERLCARRGAGPRHAAASALSGSSASLRLRSVHPLKTFKGFDKNKKNRRNEYIYFFKNKFFIYFSLLGLEIRHFRPQNRILHSEILPGDRF